jgi:hypothetical protein
VLAVLSDGCQLFIEKWVPAFAMIYLSRHVSPIPCCSQYVLFVVPLAAGESDPIKKTPEEDPWVRSGTQVRVELQRWALSVGS